MLLSQRFVEAFQYAATLHALQRRKISGAPYLSHLMRVAGIALDHGADEDEAIAALLHDAVEDQGGATTLDAITERFGSNVARIVLGCSDTDQTPKPPWRQRKEAYIAALTEADRSIRLVSASDKLDNVRAVLADYRRMGDALWRHFHGGRDGVLWFYPAVAEVLRHTQDFPIAEELHQATTTLVAELARVQT